MRYLQSRSEHTRVAQNSGKNQKEGYVEEYPEGCEFKWMGIRRFVINYSICHG